MLELWKLSSMSEHTDIKLKSWGNGSSSGPWVKIDLLDEEDLEFFKSQMGNGFHMVLVPIDCGEPQEEVKETETIVEPVTVKKGLKLSNEAHFMVQEDSFGDYLKKLTGKDHATFQMRDFWLKQAINVKSKGDLDKAGMGLEQQAFRQIRDEWRMSVNG